MALYLIFTEMGERGKLFSSCNFLHRRQTLLCACADFSKYSHLDLVDHASSTYFEKEQGRNAVFFISTAIALSAPWTRTTKDLGAPTLGEIWCPDIGLWLSQERQGPGEGQSPTDEQGPIPGLEVVGQGHSRLGAVPEPWTS